MSFKIDNGNLELDLTKYEVGGIITLDISKTEKNSDVPVEGNWDDDDECDGFKKSNEQKSQEFFKLMMQTSMSQNGAAQAAARGLYNHISGQLSKKKKVATPVIKKGLVLTRTLQIAIYSAFLGETEQAGLVYTFELLPVDATSLKKKEEFTVMQDSIIAYEPPCEMQLLTNSIPEIRKAIVKRRHLNIMDEIRKFINEGKIDTWDKLIEMLIANFGDRKLPQLIAHIARQTNKDVVKSFELFSELKEIMLDG